MKLLFLIALVSGQAWAQQTDLVCVNQCRASGQSYNLCSSKCTVDDSRSSRPKSTDLRCIQDCRSLGYSYNLCESRCSY